MLEFSSKNSRKSCKRDLQPVNSFSICLIDFTLRQLRSNFCCRFGDFGFYFENLVNLNRFPPSHYSIRITISMKNKNLKNDLYPQMAETWGAFAIETSKTVAWNRPTTPSSEMPKNLRFLRITVGLIHVFQNQNKVYL